MQVNTNAHRNKMMNSASYRNKVMNDTQKSIDVAVCPRGKVYCPDDMNELLKSEGFENKDEAVKGGWMFR